MSERPPETRSRHEPIQVARDELDGPCLQWVSIEEPNQSVVLAEDDHVLDSYFNPEFDVWETLIIVQPEDEEEEEEE